MPTDRWQQISALYHEALARPRDERPAYVRDACAGDDSLKSEVEALLAVDREAALVDTPALEAAARAIADEAGPALIGRRLGAYQITAFLGAGGMGEVYKARDTRLDRTVAIKIIPAALASDPQFRERFHREARAISQLDHPHICTLYDVGEQDGTAFLVMQYLEGETLDQRLKKGAIPIDRALQYAIQIAGALDKAHRANIVHRDLKPGNIMITKTGATLLDFGLAKAGVGAGAARGLSMLPTRPSTLTAEGAILGTVQYMAPEQIEGREADTRTDIFAFGVVLYEMLTGTRAFAGETHAGLISAILRDEMPPISAHQPATPLSLDHIVRRCLAKDSDERWQTAADVMRELTWVAESAGRSSVDTRHRTARLTSRERIGWASATIAAIGAASILGILSLRRTPASDNPPMRFEVAPPKGVSLTLGNVGQESLAISPDGSRLAFVARRGTTTMLFVRAFDAFEARPLAATDGAGFPFWSPDSRTLGFFTNGKTLKTVDASGGTVRVLGQAQRIVSGGTWGRDGSIVFGSIRDGLFTIPASGGQPVALTRLDAAQGEVTHRFPVFLPDGRRFLYSSQPSNTVWLASVDSKEARPLLTTDSQVQYVEPGYLLFGRQATLMAQAFDWQRGILTGDAVRLEQQVLRDPNAGSLAFAASTGGALAYRSEADAPTTQLMWFDRSGRRIGTIESTGPYRNISLSPDAKRVAVEVTDALTHTQDVWLLDVGTGVASRFTFDPANEIFPTWSPDGSWIMFGSDRSGVINLYQKRSNGAGGDELLVRSSVQMSPITWTPDGSAVLYNTFADGPIQIGVLPLIGDRTPRLFERKNFPYSQGRVSPDGKWMAYISSESGPPDVVTVESFPTPGGGKWQFSKNGATQLRWRPDGREIIYYSSDGQLMGVPIGNGPALEIGAPVPLFEAPLLGNPALRRGYAAQFDVAPDGRLLLNVPAEDSTPSPIHVVVNWTALLKK